MSVQLLRNSRLWVTTGDPDATPAKAITPDNTWEILLQSDFSISQDSNSTDISLNEGGAKPTRGSARFEDSLNPAEWNFSTYILPFVEDQGSQEDATDDVIITPDVALWHSLSSGSPFNLTDDHGVKANKTNMLVKFTDNQYHELNKLTFYWLIDSQWYKIENAQINQAEISVDIDGIGMVAWSGQGTQQISLGDNSSRNPKRPFDPDSANYSISSSYFRKLQKSYIKNKLTTLYIENMRTGKSYNIPITSSSITINNNITYLTPSTLSRVDIPIGSFTGSFEVTGSLEAYLRSSNPLDYLDPDSKNYSASLQEDLLKELSVTNKFQVSVCMGGVYDNPAPGAVLTMPAAHLSMPSTETEDVLSTTVEFKAIPSDMSAGDEIYIGMSPKFITAEVDSLRKTGDANNNYLDDPTITVQPTGTSISVGDTLTLSVTGTNVDRAQWFKEGYEIPSAVNTTFTTSNASDEYTGEYFVRVFNEGGEFLDSDKVQVTVS